MSRHTKLTTGHLHNTSLLPVIKRSQDVEPYPREKERPETGPGPGPATQGWSTPREIVHHVPVQDPRIMTRVDYIEDRLLSQDKSIQALLERAYRIKEDIISALSIQHGTWVEEKRSRELLGDHIHTITSILAKLSRDIAVLDEQMKSRGGNSQYTQESVKNLEMHHVAGVTDLRGRVARCDASIARLSSDMKGVLDANKSANHHLGGQNEKLGDRLLEMDRKIHDLMGKLDKVYTEHDLQIQHLDSNSTLKVTTLDAKTRAMIEEMRQALRNYQANEQTERDKLEARLVSYVENASRQKDAKVDDLEGKLIESINGMNSTIARLEEEIRKERERNEMAQRALEDKLNGNLDAHLKKQSNELIKLKLECREGFTTVQESIVNMKKVMDGKYRLLEEQIKREISSIRKMVVLI